MKRFFPILLALAACAACTGGKYGIDGINTAPDGTEVFLIDLDAKYLRMQADLADSVVRTNPDNLFGAIVMEDLAATDTARFMARYKEVSAWMRDFYQVRDAYESVVGSTSTAPGKMFTDYLVPGVSLPRSTR